MRKNVKRTIAVLSAVCMLPCPQVANVAVMAQNVSVGSSIGAKTLKRLLDKKWCKNKIEIQFCQ